MRGTVKWFNDTRGFGIIDSDEFERDVYVHFSEIETKGARTLESGMEVEFEVEKRADQYCATEVCPENPTAKPVSEWLG